MCCHNGNSISIDESTILLYTKGLSLTSEIVPMKYRAIHSNLSALGSACPQYTNRRGLQRHSMVAVRHK